MQKEENSCSLFCYLGLHVHSCYCSWSAIGYVQLLQAAAANTCAMNDQVDTDDNDIADYDNTNELTSREISCEMSVDDCVGDAAEPFVDELGII